MKILFVTDVFPPHCGGSGWSVYFFARGLRKRGHEVRIVSLDRKPRSYDGFEVQSYSPTPSTLPFFGNLKAESHDLPQIGREIEKEARDFDIIHAHHKWSTIAVGSSQIRFFATVRDYWPICICGKSTFRTEAACTLQDFTKCSEEQFGWPGLLAPICYPWFEPRMRRRRELLKKAEKIFCISQYVRDQLLPFFPIDQLTVLPNFSESIEAAPPRGLPERFCIYIGKLEQNKGSNLLPELMQQSRCGLPLVLVGDGILRTGLEDEFKQRGLEALFLGYREYPEMMACLKRAEFLIFPSLWAEPLGRVLVEAAMLGKPAIAFSHPGGHHDVITNGQTGLVADSPEQFAEAIFLLSTDAILRERLGNAARQVYDDKFHPDLILDRMLMEYNKSLGTTH